MFEATLYFKKCQDIGEFIFDKQFKYFNIFYIFKKIAMIKNLDETLSFGTWIGKH